ncbi:MAG: hypothetical protein AB4290_08270 [Spirulina sp.]
MPLSVEKSDRDRQLTIGEESINPRAIAHILCFGDAEIAPQRTRSFI